MADVIRDDPVTLGLEPPPEERPRTPDMIAAMLAIAEEEQRRELEIDNALHNPAWDLTEEDKEYILRTVLEDIAKADEYLRPIRLERTRNYAAYRGKAYGNEQKGRSSFVSSDIMDTIEWIMPSLLKVFLSGDQVVQIVGRKASDDENVAAVQELVDWQIKVKNKGFLLFYEWFKDALMYPNAYVETGWNKVVEPRFAESMTPAEFLEKADSPDWVIYSATPVRETRKVPGFYDPVAMEFVPDISYDVTVELRDVKYGRVRENHPHAVCFHPSEFLIEQGATSIQDANFVGRRYSVPFSWLKARERTAARPSGIYENLDQLRDVLLADDSGGGLQEQEQERRLQALESDVGFIEADRRTDRDLGRTQVKIVRCWVRLDPKGTGDGTRYLVEIANSRVLIRCEPLVFRHGEVPICDLKATIDPHQHFGISVASELQQLQKLKSALVRQIIDNIAFSNNGQWWLRRGANVDLRSLINPKPRGFVWMDDIERDVKLVAPQYFGERALKFVEYLDSVKENKTGVTRYNQGLDADSLNKTARGINQIMAASQQRVETIARLFAETGVSDLVRHFVEMNMQFLDKKQTVRLLDRTIELDPARLQFQYDMIINVGIGTGNRQQQLQDLTLINDRLLANPLFRELGMVGPVEIFNIVESWLTAMGRKDVTRFVNKEALLAQVQAQAQAAQAQAVQTAPPGPQGPIQPQTAPTELQGAPPPQVAPQPQAGGM